MIIADIARNMPLGYPKHDRVWASINSRIYKRDGYRLNKAEKRQTMKEVGFEKKYINSTLSEEIS